MTTTSTEQRANERPPRPTTPAEIAAKGARLGFDPKALASQGRRKTKINHVDIGYYGELPVVVSSDPRAKLTRAIEAVTAVYAMPWATNMSPDQTTRRIQRTAFKSRWVDVVGEFSRTAVAAAEAKLLSPADLSACRSLLDQLMEQGRQWGWSTAGTTRGRLSAARRYIGRVDGDPLPPLPAGSLR